MPGQARHDEGSNAPPTPLRHPGLVPGSTSPRTPHPEAPAATWMPDQVRRDEECERPPQPNRHPGPDPGFTSPRTPHPEAPAATWMPGRARHDGEESRHPKQAVAPDLIRAHLLRVAKSETAVSDFTQRHKEGSSTKRRGGAESPRRKSPEPPPAARHPASRHLPASPTQAAPSAPPSSQPLPPATPLRPPRLCASLLLLSASPRLRVTTFFFASSRDPEDAVLQSPTCDKPDPCRARPLPVPKTHSVAIQPPPRRATVASP